MVKRINILLTAIGLIMLTGFLFAFSGQNTSFTTDKTKYIVVMNAFMNRSNIYKPNAALLITDKKTIANNEKLFLGNKAYGHACGYHYAVQFWASANNQINEIPFNEECEEFSRSNSKIQATMKGYVKQLETKPTHYIYNLRIPVSIEPKNAIQSFKNSGLHLFFMDGNPNQYTTLGFAFLQVAPIKDLADRKKWQKEQAENERNAIKKINQIVDSIKTVAPIVEQSDISFPIQSFGGGTIEHQGVIALKFKNGIDLKEVKAIIERNKGKVGSEYIPTDYCIQLVDVADNLEAVKQKLKTYPIITAVYEYPNIK